MEWEVDGGFGDKGGERAKSDGVNTWSRDGKYSGS